MRPPAPQLQPQADPGWEDRAREDRGPSAQADQVRAHPVQAEQAADPVEQASQREGPPGSAFRKVTGPGIEVCLLAARPQVAVPHRRSARQSVKVQDHPHGL
jgi:hypothetical protein